MTRSTKVVTVLMVLALVATACHRLIILGSPVLVPDHTILTRPFVGSTTSMFDGEGMAYVKADNSIWLADDNGDNLFQIDADSGALINTISAVTLGAATEFGGSAVAGLDRSGDLEAVAYDEVGDTLYAVSDGCCLPTSEPTIFRLIRSGNTFVPETWQGLIGDHPAAAATGGQLYLSNTSSTIFPYDYVTNAMGSGFTIAGVSSITGLAFSSDGLDAWIAGNNTVWRVDWTTKAIVPGYAFGAADHGLQDARAVEVVNAGLGQPTYLYVQDGYDLLPGSDPLKYAIHVYTIDGVEISPAKPIASFTATPAMGLAPLTVTFDGSASTDPDGTISVYHHWYGDFALDTTFNPVAVHTYNFPGVYTAFSLAEDDAGHVGAAVNVITVKEPNVAPVLDPVGGPFAATQGTELTFTATASDTNVPADDLSFSLADGASGAVPAGATIDPVTGVFSWTPDGSQLGAFTFDVVVTDNGFPPMNDFETITVNVADANVAPILDPIGNQNAVENVAFTFTATATDTDPGDTITFSLANGASGLVPAGAAIDPNTGVFTWTPTSLDLGDHTFDVVVTDDGVPVLSDSETITITVNVTNVAPVLDPVGNQTVDETVELAFTATATDANPGDTLTFSLADGASGSVPAGATIDPNTGAFSFTPGETEGGNVYTFDVVVTDDGFPVQSDSETITVTVNDTNSAPVLDPIGNQTLVEAELLTFTATASDSDDPADTLTFSLDPGATGGIPAGPSIDPNTGVFTWTPNQFQAPGTFTFDIVVTDNGTPALEDRETIVWTVLETNVAPVLDPIGAQTVDETVELAFTATATDANVPAQNLTFTLADGASGLVPAGAAIDANTGAFTWTPGEADGGSVFTFDVVVTDDGVSPPTLSDSETITVTVNDTNVAPVLDPVGAQGVEELQLLTFTATANDSDIPADTLTFSLANGASGLVPAGAAIDPNTGVFTWTPGSLDVGTHTFDVVVTDDGTPVLSDSETITVTVDEINVAPVLDPIGNQTVDELVELTFTATATDANTVPVNTLTFSLADGASGAVPAGATIDPNTGAFSWTPGEGQDGVHTFDVVVTDDGAGTVGPLSDSETITVTVNEVNVAPVLDPVGNQTVDELVELTFTATATDADLPANALTFSLADGASGSVPAGATIDPNTGAFSWTPSELDGGTVFTFDVVVTDDGTPTLSDSETITVTVNDVNQAPVLDPVGNQSVDELVELTFTATATDADVGDTLTFSLADGASGAVPAGATIDPNTGAFSWTPGEGQDGVHTFDVVVTDDGTPTLSDSETITVTVAEVNVAPVLDPIGAQTLDELTLHTFTATATDADLPANTLTFSLEPGLGGAVPAGPAIDPNTGVFTWTPTEAQGPGTYTFDIVVSDGVLEDRETIVWTVNEVP